MGEEWYFAGIIRYSILLSDQVGGWYRVIFTNIRWKSGRISAPVSRSSDVSYHGMDALSSWVDSMLYVIYHVTSWRLTDGLTWLSLYVYSLTAPSMNMCIVPLRRTCYICSIKFDLQKVTFNRSAMCPVLTIEIHILVMNLYPLSRLDWICGMN